MAMHKNKQLPGYVTGVRRGLACWFFLQLCIGCWRSINLDV